MSDRLQLLLNEVTKLPQEEQDQFVERMLSELADEKEWARKFAASPHVLEMFAEEARADHAAGRTRPIEELFECGP